MLLGGVPVGFSLERSFRLQNLAANLPAGICGCVEIEIPLTIHQLLSLFRCQGRHTINRTCYRASLTHNVILNAGVRLNRKLWLRIRPRRRWSMKVRCDDWTSQPAELNLNSLVSVSSVAVTVPVPELSLGGTSAEAFKSPVR
jgi:hypothetical protein